MANRTKVLFICHGNICRSPMAEFILADIIKKRGLEDKLYVASCATSRDEIGNDTHYGTRNKLNSVGIPMYPRASVQLTKEDYKNYDYLLAMDNLNLRNIKKIIPSDPENKIYPLLHFAGISRDIADPWYTGNFDETYDDITLGIDAFLKFLEKNHKI